MNLYLNFIHLIVDRKKFYAIKLFLLYYLTAMFLIYFKFHVFSILNFSIRT